jgi:hypothetical protein
MDITIEHNADSSHGIVNNATEMKANGSFVCIDGEDADGCAVYLT